MEALTSCCICSSLLYSYESKTEQPITAAKTLSCCDRVVCLRCITKNARYNTYCPYCQISSGPSVLPQGLRDPPSYDASIDNNDRQMKDESAPTTEHVQDILPTYDDLATVRRLPLHSKHAPAEDVLHFVTPNDSLQSLSLAYGVPVPALRKTNYMYADHLLQGRKTLLIPSEYYRRNVSLSPQPIETEEQEIRKTKLRRFMVTCKVSDYDVAVLYLEQAKQNLDSAIEAYLDDERWEKEHPILDDSKNKPGKQSAKTAGMRRFVGLAG